MDTVPSIAPRDVDLERYDIVLDVRPYLGGVLIPGSAHAPLDDLLADPEAYAPDRRAHVLLVCDIGMRSAFAADHLRKAGYDSVASLEGGIDFWKREGLPTASAGSLTGPQLERYDRHIKLPGIGLEGQRGLLEASVAVVGAGGLGVPVISYLAAAGVGSLTVIDGDVVEISNLQRQPIFTSADIGVEKVSAVALYIASLNPEVNVRTHATTLTEENADDLFDGVDLVIDATDSFEARYAISDAGQRLGVPVVTGAVYRWEGQVTTLLPGGPCYRCIFPDPPDAGVVLDCELTGVLGSVVGTVGTLQATEAVNLITGTGTSLAGRLVMYDGRAARFDEVRVGPRNDCVGCGPYRSDGT